MYYFVNLRSALNQICELRQILPFDFIYPVEILFFLSRLGAIMIRIKSML